MTIFEQLHRPLTRLSLTLIEDPGREFVAFFNPETLEEQLSANYVRQEVPGLPRQPLQYINTSNLRLNARLRFKAETGEELVEVAEGRRFLQACLYPFSEGGAPPRVLFLWPPEWSLIVHILSVGGEARMWNADGVLIHYEADVAFEEVTTEIYSFDDVLRNGTVRGSRRR